MSLNNKETQGSGSKILRSNLSKVFKAALDNDLTLDGQTVDDTDLEEPNIIIEDLSNAASEILSDRAPDDLISPESVLDNSSRILSQVFSMLMGRVDFESLKQTMQAARIETEIENILSKKILERMYQGDPEKINYLSSKISQKHSQIYSKIKKLGFEADALYNMILNSSKSNISENSLKYGAVDYGFLDQNIKDIFMSVYSGSFSPAMFLKLHEEGFSNTQLDLKNKLITDYSKVLKKIAEKPLKDVDFHNYCRTGGLYKVDLTQILYQLLHDISFSLNHGLSPDAWSSWKDNGIQLLKDGSLEEHRRPNQLEAPYLSDLGWNGNYNLLKNTGYPGYDQLVKNYGEEIEAKLKDNLLEALAIQSIMLPFPSQDYVPTAWYNHTDPNRSPAYRVKEWIDSGVETWPQENAIQRVARVSACLASEFQISRGLHNLPPRPTKGSPVGSSVFGEMNHNVYNLDEDSDFYDYDMTSGVVPKLDNKPFYFYEKAIKYKDYLNSSNDRKDFTSEFVSRYTSSEERGEKQEVVRDLEDFLKSQDDYVKKLWNSISKLNNVEENSYLSDPEEQPSQVDSSYAGGKLSDNLAKAITPERIMASILLPVDTIYDQIRKSSEDPTTWLELVVTELTRNRIVAQAYALCFISDKFRKDDIPKGTKDTMRGHVVQAIINRDIARAMDGDGVSPGYGESPVFTRYIGYTRDMLSRQAAIITLSKSSENIPNVFANLGNTDNQKFSVGDLIGLTVNPECNKKFEPIKGWIDDAVDAQIFRGRNQKELAAKMTQKDVVAYICGSYFDTENITTPSDDLDVLSSRNDLYDSIIAAVDQIDKLIHFGYTKGNNSSILIDKALTGDPVIQKTSYFHKNAGVTKASGLDRSLLISIVVDCVAEILGNLFYGSYIRKYNKYQTGKGVFYWEKNPPIFGDKDTFKGIPMTMARIELHAHDLPVTRLRYDADAPKDIAAGIPGSVKNDKVSYIPSEPSKKYPHVFNQGSSAEKKIGMLSAFRYCLISMQSGLRSNRIRRKSDLDTYFRSAYVERITEDPYYFHTTKLQKEWFGPNGGYAALEAFKDIIGEDHTAAPVITGGGDDYLNFFSYHYGKIEKYLLSHRASLKAATEFVTLHGAYTNSMRAFVNQLKYTERQFIQNNPEEWYTSLLTKTQVYKSIQNLNKQYSVINAAPDDDDNFLFRETVSPEMWKVIDLFIDQKINETSYDENRNYVFYGTTPCSFYGALSYIGDTPGGVENTNPTVDGISVTAQITNPLDETIEFKPSVDTEIFISANLFLDESSIFSAVNQGAATWEALRDEVIIIPGRQIPGISEVSPQVRSEPSMYLNYVRENHGFTLAQFKQNSQDFPYLEDFGVDEFEGIVDNLLKSFCMRFIGETLYSLTLDPARIFWERVTSSLVFPPEDSGPGASFMDSYRNVLSDIGVDLKDLEEKLLQPAWETFLLAQNPKKYELMGTKDRIPFGVNFEKLFKPRPIINSQGEAKIVPPQINDEEIYVADCIFSSLLFQNLSLRFGTPLFEEIHVLEYGIEKTEGDPMWESVHPKYLKSVDNSIPLDGLGDLATSRAIRVVSPRVEILGE